MGRRVTSRNLELLRMAEEGRMCLVPTDKTLGRWLARQVDAGTVARPQRGFYVSRSLWDGLGPRDRQVFLMRSHAATGESPTFSHVSAAIAHGLEVPRRLCWSLHSLTSRMAPLRSDQGMIRHPSDTADGIMCDGMLVTSIDRTVFDCMRTLCLPEGLAVVDSALRLGLATRDGLRGSFDSWSRCPGYRHAIQTLGFADARSENGGESVVRGVMIELSRAPSELQVEIPDPLGGKTYRGDFGWLLPSGQWVIGELDGFGKYTDVAMTGGRDVRRVLLDERLRESRISASGAKVMRFRYGMVFDRGAFLRLLDAFGVPAGSSVPERLPHPGLMDGVTRRRAAMRPGYPIPAVV